MHIENVLRNMEEKTELFETLLCSYSFWLHAVKNAKKNVTLIIDYIHYKMKRPWTISVLPIEKQIVCSYEWIMTMW